MVTAVAAAREARPIVMEAALRSPLIPAPAGADAGGAALWLKLENLQPTGSFKIRGMYHAVRRLPADATRAGLLTVSAGNAGLGVAFAAARLGLPCTVVVPDGASTIKVAALRRLGARVEHVPFADWWAAFDAHAFPGLPGAFVHPFDDAAVMDGHATIALEIVEDLPDVQTVVIPFGGGGLLIGVARALRELRPGVRIIAAEAANGAPLAASLAAGANVEVEYSPSLADGIVGRDILPRIWTAARDLVDRSEPIAESDIEATVRWLVERARLVAEGSAAAALAVARRLGPEAGQTVCIVSGGNIDTARLAAILEAPVSVTAAGETA